ncbi:hypothetical protein NDU88_001630 [Pleurodeles waltl]|uniref:Uncharacterized protein n=1 Tax=Pleurodeles waltl TaxID=8319 RepID=A0AAV7U7E4_PLEWA|nr:hypothetical protein NDU88_001630 [Pleurodeles waltl]
MCVKPRKKIVAEPGHGHPAPSEVLLGCSADGSAGALGRPGGGVKANNTSTCHRDSPEAARQERKTGRRRVEGEEAAQLESGGGPAWD